MSSNNQFIYPGPPGVAGDYSSAVLVQYGSPQEFNWTISSNIHVNLVLLQETPQIRDDTLASTIPPFLAFSLYPMYRMREDRADTFPSSFSNSAHINTTNYYWDGRPSQNLHLSDIFFVALFNSSNSTQKPLCYSQYINVTTGAAISSSTTSTSSSSSSTVSTSSSSGPVAQPITTPTSAAPTTAPKSKSNHVALGAGLGVGLGGAALLLTAVLLYFLSQKRRSKSGKLRPPEVYQLSGISESTAGPAN